MLVLNQHRWLSFSCLGLKLSLRLRLSLKKAYKHVLSLLDLFQGNGDPWKWGKKNGSNPVHFHETPKVLNTIYVEKKHEQDIFNIENAKQRGFKF